jgi:flagellar motor component MotA
MFVSHHILIYIFGGDVVAQTISVNNEFEKDVFKLMNNAVFGKTIENLRKRLIVQLVNNQSKARKLTSKPTFHAFRIFNEAT